MGTKSYNCAFAAESKTLGAGRVTRVARPPQGCNFQVYQIRTSQGCFIRKTGDTDAKIAGLEREAVLLSSIGPSYYPFVPTFAGRIGRAFYFCYLPGTDGATAWGRADRHKREEYAVQFGAALRCVHGWTPPLPYPATDWLSDAVQHCTAHAMNASAAIEDTNSIFNNWNTDAVAAELEADCQKWQTKLAWSHGDWCLPNVLFQNGTVSGVIDWSDGEWKDKRYDLATGVWTIRRNSPQDPAVPCYHAAFLRGYGFDGEVQDLRFFEALYTLL